MKNKHLTQVLKLAREIVLYAGLVLHSDQSTQPPTREVEAAQAKTEIAHKKVMEKVSRKTTSTVTTVEVVERVSFVE